MTRQLRVDFPGARHHCMNRGLRKQTIFHDDRDAAAFCDRLSELPERFGIEVHGYALMPNHFHLMLRSVDGNLSEAMRWLSLVYTQRTNRRYGWDGPLFRGRFRSCVVDSEVYWGHLLAYLHLNPVRAGLVMTPDQGCFTSHKAYLGRAERRFLSMHELRAWYGSEDAYRDYLVDLQSGRAGWPEGFADVVEWKGGGVAGPDIRGWRVGEARAATWVQEITGEPWWHPEPKSGPAGNPRLAFAMWTMHRVGGVPQRQLAGRLAIPASTVQTRVASFAGRRHRDPVLWRWLGQLERRVPGFCSVRCPGPRIPCTI